jgi:hypothetical protein
MKPKTVYISNHFISSVDDLAIDLDKIEDCTEIKLTNCKPPLLPSTAFKLGYAFCLGKKINSPQPILSLILNQS